MGAKLSSRAVLDRSFYLAGEYLMGHEVVFAKGEEVIVKGLRFVVACQVRRMGILILKIKESHGKDNMAHREAQDLGLKPGAV
jgi:hypothetical protein